MNDHVVRPRRRAWLKLFLLVSIIAAALLPAVSARATGSRSTAVATSIRMPLIMGKAPRTTPLGVEFDSQGSFVNTVFEQRLEQSGASMLRLHQRLSWRELQPDQNGPIRWNRAAGFETELRRLRALGIRPIVVIWEAPDWARRHGNACAAMHTHAFDEFAAFVTALVNRYSGPEYNLHDWEFWNEPDVAPELVSATSRFGCWGDLNDPYYGGRHYGEMLKVAGNAVHQADPSSRVWSGGLLLDRPDTPGNARPEHFFEGMLLAGAGPHIDVVAYHAYSSYGGQPQVDYDLSGRWSARGGATVGKAQYLRAVMAAHGISRPVVANETGLLCPETVAACAQPQSSGLYGAQADHLARSYTRGLSAGVAGLVWYSLNNGWRDSGLLDSNQATKPAFTAFKFLASLLDSTTPGLTPGYGSGIVAHRFDRVDRRVDILWSTDGAARAVSVPAGQFVAAYRVDGQPLAPTSGGSQLTFVAGFSPIYIVRTP